MCYNFGYDEDRAVRIWENVTRMVNSPEVRNIFSRAKESTLFALANHYLVKATEAGGDIKNAKEYGQKLERLAEYRLDSTSL